MGNDSLIAASHKLCSFVKTGSKILRGNEAHIHIFCYYLLANCITDPSSVCKLMDCSATVFVDELLNCYVPKQNRKPYSNKVKLSP
jgi:hypothetical protein